jgi:peptide/nickel transport system ATP-binding protein
MKLKEELKMTIVFITHDIGLAYYVSDRLFIMHKGKIVEQGTPDDVTLTPKNEHTRILLDDIPDMGPVDFSRNVDAFTYGAVNE